MYSFYNILSSIMMIKLNLSRSLSLYINNLFRKRASLSLTNDRMNGAHAAHAIEWKTRKKTIANSWSQQRKNLQQFHLYTYLAYRICLNNIRFYFFGFHYFFRGFVYMHSVFFFFVIAWMQKNGIAHVRSIRFFFIWRFCTL